MKLLITGFDAFGKDDYNPSFEAIKALPDKIHDVEVIKLQLPTKYLEASSIIIDYLDNNTVDYVFLCGQAAGRKEITLEKFAVNVMDARIADNAEYIPKDITILDEGETAYETSIDLIAMEKFMNDKGTPTKISYHAGTFVCNSTYYNLLHKSYHDGINTKGLFIHVPIIPSQQSNYEKELPTMSLENITKALYTAVEYISQ